MLYCNKFTEYVNYVLKLGWRIRWKSHCYLLEKLPKVFVAAPQPFGKNDRRGSEPAEGVWGTVPTPHKNSYTLFIPGHGSQFNTPDAMGRTTRRTEAGATPKASTERLVHVSASIAATPAATAGTRAWQHAIKRGNRRQIQEDG